ncbi:unnamed protein product [Rhizoctonia solani]|uniref:Uncharacterized protein n=1 Tax=Rhizoctonia solani TaxID=456999 RepID=A0A8H2XQX0_9AGAM|nr:unnamed protein product [Rhizoctonia solani]
MNGIPAHMPSNMSGPPRRTGNSPAGGLVPTITSSLRGVIMYNQTALTQAISQIEAIGDIQNELVNARAAHAQVSKDLQICMERHAAQNRLLLQTQDELRVVTQNLHGAREQLGLLESRLASVDGKEQVLACFKALRSEFDAVVNAAQSYTSRNAMLEATITTIKSLHISAAPAVTQPAVVDARTTVDRKSPLRDSPVDGEIEMDVERTEAARVARQNSSATPSAQPQPTARLTSIQPSDASRSVGAASSTPTQPTFFAQQTDSPQRKRQRTLTSGGTPEPLPRDNILHVYIRLVSATYKVQLAGSASGGNNIPAGEKQVICKLCETRHKDQPDFPVATFPYDQDTLPVVPPLADAESTRTRVQPWIDHIQQKHQKMYNTIMERARPRSSTTASAASTS